MLWALWWCLNLFYGFNSDIFSYVFVLQMQIKGNRWGIVSQQRQVSFISHLLGDLSCSPRSSKPVQESFLLPLQTFESMVSHFKVYLHRFSFHSCFPHFWNHDGGTQAKDSSGSTWGNGSLLPSVSTLDAAIIVFYMEKKLFALNSLLEENGFTFLECVRTPWQGWNINRIKKKPLYLLNIYFNIVSDYMGSVIYVNIVLRWFMGEMIIITLVQRSSFQKIVIFLIQKIYT